MCFFVYLIGASLHAAGWKFSGLGLSLGFDIALIIVLGLPVAVVSAGGSLFGVALSKRMKRGASSLGTNVKVAMPKWQKVILLTFIALALGLMFIGRLTVQ